jgi:hypothetical protein
VLATLGEHPELEYDAHGNIVGSGLTLLPTPHQFRVNDQPLFTWCAMDTLSYPVRLNLVAHVTSRCPATGGTIRLTVTPDKVLDLDPPGAVVSLVIPEAVEAEATACCRGDQNGCQNVREDVCNYGHFFASHEAAAPWHAMHPHAVILPVAEAYRVGALVEGYHALALAWHWWRIRRNPAPFHDTSFLSFALSCCGAGSWRPTRPRRPRRSCRPARPPTDSMCRRARRGRACASAGWTRSRSRRRMGRS